MLRSVVASLLLSAFLTPAQEVTSSITGSIADPSAAPFRVRRPSSSPNKPAARSEIADAQGSFVFTAGRVMIVGNPNGNDRSTLTAFITAAIAAPPVAACQVPNPPFSCWGTAPRNVFHGPGINNWDTSLFKNIVFLSERLRAQFRVEAYNVFNHTQFTTVNTAAVFNASGQQTSGTCGQYTAAANPKQLQLALRLMF